MGIFLDVVLVTSQAMGTILLVCSVGYYLARRKFLSPQIQAPVSWITINILVPTLMIASAGSFTSKQLLTWYYLLIIPIFQVIFSNILGRVGACVFTHFYSWSPVAQEIFILLSTFSNNQALPLVLVRTIGNSEELFGEYEDPKEVGTAMVMIYSAAVTVLMFTFVPRAIVRIRHLTEPESHPVKQSTSRGDGSPHAAVSLCNRETTVVPGVPNSQDSSGVGASVTHIRLDSPVSVERSDPAKTIIRHAESVQSTAPELRCAVENSVGTFAIEHDPSPRNQPGRYKGRAQTLRQNRSRTLSEPSLFFDFVHPTGRYSQLHDSTALDYGGADGQNGAVNGGHVGCSTPADRSSFRTLVCETLHECKVVSKQCVRIPGNIAVVIMIVVASCEPLKRLFFKACSPDDDDECEDESFPPLFFVMAAVKVLGDGALPVALLLLAAGLAKPPPVRGTLEADLRESREDLDHRFIFIMCLFKLVILPAFFINVLTLFLGVFPEDDMLRLVILLEVATPSAQSIVNFFQVESRVWEVRNITRIYLVMYLASIPILALWTLHCLMKIFG
eukprot:Rmarinus@m.17026